MRRKNNKIQRILSSVLTGILLLTPLYGCSPPDHPLAPFIPEDYIAVSTEIREQDDRQTDGIMKNPYDFLNVPTYITKIDGLYFIVDCYHDQIIYHHTLEAPLTEWNVMTSDVSMAHTLASDGQVYMIDDTENNRILIMEKQIKEGGIPFFLPTQEFNNIGNRPHYIIYHEPTDTFYAWSSQTGEMYLFRHPKEDPTLYLTEVRIIDSLKNAYVRSFTIIGNEIYFVSGNSSILKADLTTFQILEEYPVPDEMAGMAQLTLIDGYFYITISTDKWGSQDSATLIRVKDLKELMTGNYEDVYHHFIGGGTPYYITYADAKWFLTEHRLPGHSIWSFGTEDGNITDVTLIH